MPLNATYPAVLCSRPWSSFLYNVKFFSHSIGYLLSSATIQSLIDRTDMPKMESITDEINNHFANDKDLEILVVASFQTLKRGNKKCGREEVWMLVNDSLKKDITKEAFELILNSVIDNHSRNVCLYPKNPVRLVMIKLIIMLIS